MMQWWESLVTYWRAETMDTLGGTELIIKSGDQFVQFFQCTVAVFAAAAYISHVKSHTSQ